MICKCNGCGQKAVAADQGLCLRCDLGSRDIMRAEGLHLDDEVRVTTFVAWAKPYREGGGINLAIMCACRRAPHVSSTSTFMGGYADAGGAQFDGKHPLVQQTYVGQAKAAGVAINGKRYFSEIAAFPGDPEAWVGTKAEAADVVRRRGWASDDLGVKAPAGGPQEKAAKRDSFKSVLAKALGVG